MESQIESKRQAVESVEKAHVFPLQKWMMTEKMISAMINEATNHDAFPSAMLMKASDNAKSP